MMVPFFSQSVRSTAVYSSEVPARGSSPWATNLSATSGRKTTAPVSTRHAPGARDRLPAPSSRQLQLVELGIDDHHRKARWQGFSRYLAESVLLVEAMRGPELGGSAQEDGANAPGAGPGEQGMKERGRRTVLLAAVRAGDKHLAQRCLLVADVEKRHRADDSVTVDRHPEVPCVVLIEPADVLQIRLRLQRDRDLELGLLDRENHRDDAVGVLRTEWNHANHGPHHTHSRKRLPDGKEVALAISEPGASLAYTTLGRVVSLDL